MNIFIATIISCLLCTNMNYASENKSKIWSFPIARKLGFIKSAEQSTRETDIKNAIPRTHSEKNIDEAFWTTVDKDTNEVINLNKIDPALIEDYYATKGTLPEITIVDEDRNETSQPSPNRRRTTSISALHADRPFALCDDNHILEAFTDHKHKSSPTACATSHDHLTKTDSNQVRQYQLKISVGAENFSKTEEYKPSNDSNSSSNVQALDIETSNYASAIFGSCFDCCLKKKANNR